MTNDELKKRLDDLITRYPHNQLFNSMWQELNNNSSAVVIQKTLQSGTTPFIERCNNHLKNSGVFRKIFHAPELREIKSLKKQLIYDNLDYQERLNHAFFSDLKSRLMYNLESYLENFHFKRIAFDRKAQAENLLNAINDINIETKASARIAELFDILFKANLSIVHADTSAPTYRNLTKSRLKNIIQNYSQLISKKNRPSIRTAIATTELEKTYIEFFSPLRNKILSLKQTSSYNSNCLHSLDSILDNQSKSYNDNSKSDKKVFYSSIFTRLNSSLDWVVAEDEKLWFANFRHTQTKHTLTHSILEIIHFAKRNYLLTPYIIEAINHQITYLWALHVEKTPPNKITKSASNQSFLFQKSPEIINVQEKYNLPTLVKALPNLLKPIIIEYIKFLDETKDLSQQKSPHTFSLMM